MSEVLDIKSKKGMSLAYVLVVCLFLMMITGGIVSVALLQHNETGSDLNVRQAYISAKSGLDTMQDSLKNKVIAAGDLPITEDGEVYYIMYVDASDPDGEIHYEYRTTEEAIKLLMETMKTDSTKNIVGGEGTYFKIKKTSDVDYKVTALNTTGKYNNNTTLNQGDLSVSVAVYQSYVFGDPEPPTTDYYTDTTDSSSDFLMVGMQNSVNSVRSGGWSAYKTLNSMHKINSGGSGVGAGTQEIYVLDTQSNTGVCESFAPLVYDQTVRLTSQNEHSQISAYNEGIYFLGSATGDEINDYAFEGGNRKDLGQTSFFTQNGAYAPSFNCALLVISHNVNAVDISPRVSYYGNQSRNFVYVYLENDVTFNMCNGDGKSYNYGRSFTKFSGWYKVYNGELFDRSKWVGCGAPSADEVGCKNHLGTIRSILDSGCTLHSGGPETEKTDVKVNILGWNGDYKKRSTPSGTDNAYIYFSPSKAPYTAQEYNWRAQSFNLYWTGTDNFKLLGDAQVTVGGNSFVVTMPFNNVIEQGSAGASFKIESDVIHIMGDIKVKFNSPKTVTTEYNGDGTPKTTKTIEEFLVKKGTYNVKLVKDDGAKTGVPTWSFRKKIYDNNGFDLFSEEAVQFFDVEKIEESHGGGSPVIEEGSITLTQDIFNDPSGEYTVPKTITGKIFYKNPTADKKAHTITVTGPFKLKKQLKNNSVIVLMEFKTAGVYVIPVSEGSTEGDDGIELNGPNLDERATWVQSNYKCLEVAQKTAVDDKGYY